VADRPKQGSSPGPARRTVGPVNALQLYPAFAETFWSFRHALKFVGRRAALPPLGLVTVAAMLPRDWDLRLVDTNVRPLADADLEWADLVLVSAMNAQRASARGLVARCRAAGATLIAGGPLFDAEQDAFPEVDHFVLGEAEAILPEFLDDFARGRARRVYVAPALPDLGRTPAPRWDLLHLAHYHSMSVQFSRGCPFDCEFCDITSRFGHRPRTKSPAQVVAEIDALYARGWRGSLFFVDDNLIGPRRAIRRELLPALIAWRRGKRGMPFYTEVSIDLARDPALMAAMVEAGFGSVFIGIETPEDAGLAECNKRQNRGRDLIADVRAIQRAGLQVQGGFIVGFDSDTPSVFQRMTDFIQSSGIITAMVGMLSAPSATRLYARMKREGRLLGEMSGDNADGTTNILPRMGLEALSQGYRSVLRGIYAPGPYYRRVRTFLREFRPHPVRVAVDWRHIVALFYSGVRLGVIGRERFHFWGLMAWTLFRRPRLLPAAVTFAIYGHHFRRISAAHGA
jgi:radical SAM superfamily enzyme YgiQ (UPF0313 family)